MIIYLKMCVLFLTAFVLLAENPALARSVIFPEYKCGWIQTRPVADYFIKDTYMLDEDSWGKLYQAKGKITVPEGYELRYCYKIPRAGDNLEDGIDLCLAALDKLKEGDIQALQLSRVDGNMIKDFLGAVQKQEKIHTIYLYSSYFDGASLISIKSMESIKNILLVECYGDAPCSEIGNRGGIKRIRIIKGWVTHPTKGISALKDIEYVELFNASITNEDVDELGKCVSLKKLSINHSLDLDGSHMAALGKLVNLKQLSLCNIPKIKSTDYDYLKNLKSLERLELLNVSAGNEVADLILSMPKLRNVVINKRGIDNSKILAIKTMRPNLKLEFAEDSQQNE